MFIKLLTIFLLGTVILSLCIIYRKKMQYWLPYYIFQKLIPRQKPGSDEQIHIMFCLVDHFEPANGGVGPEIQKQRVRAWTERYPQMADKHCDADGKPPQHIWFYPPHLDHVHLESLVGLCREGYGEIEMHLHHNHMEPFPDAADTLREKIQKCIDDYSKLEIFCTPGGRKHFGFIHGDWSLANSRGEKYCGVNDELQILKETGCYADFTFPCLNEAQPKKVNTIYYAFDKNTKKPKSYNSGIDIKVNGKPKKAIMIIQGPIGLRWNFKDHKIFPSIESANIDRSDLPTRNRIDYWVKNGIFVKGKPEWIFLKIHTHGAPEEAHEVLLGKFSDEMYSYLEEIYNDGEKYMLHYVTARQMYNIIKAAEAGEGGNPNSFRDYEIPKYMFKSE